MNSLTALAYLLIVVLLVGAAYALLGLLAAGLALAVATVVIARQAERVEGSE